VITTRTMPATITRATWARCHVEPPAGVRMPRSSNALPIAPSVEIPPRRMSSIAARVLALALAALLDLAALAASIVCAAIGLPRFLAAVCMMAPQAKSRRELAAIYAQLAQAMSVHRHWQELIGHAERLEMEALRLEFEALR
jgi:hypothetical protein